MTYRVAILTLAVAVIAAGAGAGAYFLRKGMAQQPAQPPAVAPSPGRPQSHPIAHMMITQDAAGALAASGANGAALVAALNKPETYEVIRQGRAERDLLPAATHVESFKSYAAIQSALAGRAVPSDVRVIQYDDEHWPGTPAAEQKLPFHYVPLAEKLVHQHGLMFMNTPGADLDQVLDPKAGNQYSAYLAERLPGLAKFADVFEIQAQNAKSVAQYQSFARQAVRRAKQANASAIILLGVTAKGDGGPPSSVITSEIARTASISDGYWLNIPGTANGSSSGVPIAIPVIRDFARL